MSQLCPAVSTRRLPAHRSPWRRAGGSSGPPIWRMRSASSRSRPSQRRRRQCARFARKAGERRQALRRVERRPVGARLVGQAATPGRTAVLSAERRGAGPVERGECDAEVGVSGSVRPALVDPLEHEQRRIVGHGQHLGDGQDTRLPQPAQPRGFGREEARRRGGMRLREDSSPVGEVDREGRSDVTAVHSRRIDHPDAESLLDVVAEGQASHTWPGSRVLTSCKTQPLPSGSLKFAWFMYGRPCGSSPGWGPPSR